MDKVWKEKWLAALRSGEYQQTTGSLVNNEGFCCLGVLCLLVSKEYPKVIHLNEENDCPEFKTQDKDRSTELLPECVQEIVGINTNDPKVPNTDSGIISSTWRKRTGDETVLSYLNDSGLGFKEIANIIERNL